MVVCLQNPIHKSSTLTVKSRNIEGAYVTCNIIEYGNITWFRISEYIKLTMKQNTEYNLFKISNNSPVKSVIRKVYLNATAGFLFTLSVDGQVTITPFGGDITQGTGLNVSEVFITK